jgi:hypothetical protein
VQLAVAGKRPNIVGTSKKVCNKLDLTVTDSSIIMTGPGGLLLIVPTYM